MHGSRDHDTKPWNSHPLKKSPNALETNPAVQGYLQKVGNGSEDTSKTGTGTSDVVDGSVCGDLEWAR
jgi:hypothetical protein